MDYESFYNEAASLYQQETLSFEAWLKQMAQVAHQHKFKFTELVEVVYSITGVRISTDEWFTVVLANDAPGTDRFPVQVGVHLEECGELLTEFSTGDEELDTKLLLARSLLEEIGTVLKSGRAHVKILNRKAFFDAVLDQRVTGEGVAYLAGFNLKEGVARVDVANFTKFVDGKPLYKEGGKIAKGPNFWNPEF